MGGRLLSRLNCVVGGWSWNQTPPIRINRFDKYGAGGGLTKTMVEVFGFNDVAEDQQQQVEGEKVWGAKRRGAPDALLQASGGEHHCVCACVYVCVWVCLKASHSYCEVNRMINGETIHLLQKHNPIWRQWNEQTGSMQFKTVLCSCLVSKQSSNIFIYSNACSNTINTHTQTVPHTQIPHK